MEYAFQAEGLVKKFGKTTALAGVDLAARPATVLGVLGPNGAGKSTTVRILATLLRPDGGRATVAGLDVVRQVGEVRRRIGLTGQDTTIDEDLTGTENLVLLGQLLDLRRPEAKARAAELLDRFGLTDVAGRRASTYSGGQRRRLRPSGLAAITAQLGGEDVAQPSVERIAVSLEHHPQDLV